MNSMVQSQPEEKCYPIRTLRIFGGVQIGIGILISLLSVAGIVVDVRNRNTYCNYNPGDPSHYQRCEDNSNGALMLIFDITCLVFSGWFILTGAFPFFMSQNRRSSWRCLKITFMVCCIMGSSTFIPTVFILEVIGAVFRGAYRGGLAVLPSLVAVLAFVELVIAIVAASYCCCCSSWERHTRLVYVTPQQYGSTMSIPTAEIPIVDSLRNSQPTAYPSGGVGVMQQQYQVHTTQQYQVPTTQNIEAGAEEPPPYKE